MSRSTYILATLAVGFAGARILGFRDDVFKDLAHVFTGVLLGGWALIGRRDCCVIFSAICVVEVACAILLPR